MPDVILYTERAILRGEVDLTTTANSALRLLDALNHPQRLSKRAHRLTPSLLLTGAGRRSLVGKDPGSLLPELVIRTETILAAHEAGVATVGSPSATYERRQAEESDERLVLFLANGFRVEGDVRGGLVAMEGSREGSLFFACRNVVMSSPSAQGSARRLGFLAVNAPRVESYGPVPN